MWREVIAVMLVGISLHAQDQATNPQTKVDSPRKPVPRTETYLRYNELRRGTTEEMVVMLVANGFVSSPRTPVSGIVPVSLTLRPEPGLSFSNWKYPRTYKHKFASVSEPVNVASGIWFPIQLKVHADRTATPGVHTVIGKLNYQTITNSGVSVVQQMDVFIPITVVDHDVKIVKAVNWPIYHTPAWVFVVCILMVPLILPFLWICFLPGMDGCG